MKDIKVQKAWTDQEIGREKLPPPPPKKKKKKNTQRERDRV